MFSKELQAIYRPVIFQKLNGAVLASDEWRAWAKEWLESVPLTAKQRRENAAWHRGVKKAKIRLAEARVEFDRAMSAIEHEFGVRVSIDEEGEYRVADDDPPHRPTSRAKLGAPPEPPMWRGVTFRVGNVAFTRHPAAGEATP